MPVLAAYMVPHPPLIIPEIGKGDERQIAETISAYQAVATDIAALRPDTIVISSPHAALYQDYFHISPGREARGDFGRFGAPQVSFRERYDTELVQKIAALTKERDFPAGVLGERDPALDHGTLVPLWFTEQQYREFRLVRLGLSGFSLPDHYEFGLLIRRAVDELGRRVVYIASGDLSHKLKHSGPYGFAPEGPEYDARVMDVCSRAAFGELFDFDENFCDRAAECGHRSFVIMAGVLDGLQVEARRLSHQDVTGVGYGVCIFHPGEPDEERCFLRQYRDRQAKAYAAGREKEDGYVRLARAAIEARVRSGRKIPVPDNTAEELISRRAGVFVSIHKDGRLRGCIGTIQPCRGNIAEEIIENAVSAATRDPRFEPVRPEELTALEISVDVLSAPEIIDSEDELDVKRYGVIVSCGPRRGLLLPDLEGVDTVEEQIDIALRKGGISPRDPYTLERFEVIRHT